MTVRELTALLATFAPDLEVRATSSSIEGANNLQLDSVVQTTTRTVQDGKIYQIVSVELVTE